MILGTQKSRTPFAVLAAVVVSGHHDRCSAASRPRPRPSRVVATLPTRGTVAKNVNGKLTSKFVGTASDGSKVTGSFTPLKFVKKDGKQQVKGVVDGVVTHADGSKETFTALRTLQVKKINGKSLSGLTARSAPGMAACDILHLVLGPLDLDLLGLQVHLDKVVLDIVAATGAGNLLGNLLCAITGLLDGGPLAGLLGQLNDLLGSDPRRPEPGYLTSGERDAPASRTTTRPRTPARLPTPGPPRRGPVVRRPPRDETMKTHDRRTPRQRRPSTRRLLHLQRRRRPLVVVGRDVHLCTGCKRGDVTPSTAVFLLHLHPDDRSGVYEILDNALLAATPFTCYHRVMDRHGQEHSVLLVGRGVRDDRGLVEKLEGYVVDSRARRANWVKTYSMGAKGTEISSGSSQPGRAWASQACPQRPRAGDPAEAVT